MKHIKLTLSVFIIALVLLSVVSCNKTEPAVTTQVQNTTVTTAPVTTEAPQAPEGLTLTEEYVITFSYKADDYVNSVCRMIKNSIKDASGLSLNIRDDFKKANSVIPDYEIVVARADREKSTELSDALGEKQWGIAVYENKIYVVGNTLRELYKATEYFIDTYVTGKDEIVFPTELNYIGETKLLSVSLANDAEDVTAPGGGYPRMYQLEDKSLLLGVDGFCYISTDEGNTWSKGYDYRKNYILKGTKGQNVALSCANTAFFQLEDGTVLAAYRATGYLGGETNFITRIQVSQSKDGGKTWEFHSLVCEYLDEEGQYKGVWEPHFGLIDGVLTCFYANDSRSVVTGGYQNIEYCQWIDGKWTNRTVVSDGVKHKSRDGMPVWQQLESGKYVCAIEGWVSGSTLGIQLLWSDDGKTWSDPVTIYQSKHGNAGAPYVVELPTGQLLVSFQALDIPGSDEPAAERQMICLISDGTPVEYLTAANFSEPENVFGTYDKSTSWNTLYITDNYLYAATAGVRLKRIPLAELYKQIED